VYHSAKTSTKLPSSMPKTKGPLTFEHETHSKRDTETHTHTYKNAFNEAINTAAAP
jgi:hypothetical protein